MDPLSSRLQTLSSVPELAGCSKAQLSALLPHLDELTVAAGFEVAVEGRYCSQFVILAEGRLRSGTAGNGLHRLEPGETVGWAAMWERAQNPATVVAETPARLLVMGHGQFRAVKGVVPPPS